MNVDEVEQQRQLAVALKRVRSLELRDCFDPMVPSSRPVGKQLELIKETKDYLFQHMQGGNQSGKCLESSTLIATTRGPVAIENLQVGDFVYDEHGQPIRVLNKWHQGRQVVRSLVHVRKHVVCATGNHRWLSTSGEIVTTDDIAAGGHTIATCDIVAPLGPVDEPHAYALGAMLGDGCSDDSRNVLLISSADEKIPERVAGCVGGHAHKLSPANYTWKIVTGYRTGNRHSPIHLRHYEAWCGPHKAHQKIVDIDVVRTWNRNSVLEFVAGLLDTDGSVSNAANQITVSWTSQSTSIIAALEWCILALWNTKALISVDDRDKYVNGDCYNIFVSDTRVSKRLLKELTPHLALARKGYLEEYDAVTPKRRYLTNACRVREDRDKIADTWDIEVDSPTHLFLLANGYISHNSQTGARIVAWLFQGYHPYWNIQALWPDEPLLIIVVGRLNNQVEELWDRKIKPFLEPGSYRENRQGGTLQYVVNVRTRTKIIFATHNNPTEARAKLQSYTANFVWLDELTDYLPIIEELQRRVQAKRGRMLITFTPKIRAEAVKQFLEAPSVYSKVYRISMLDNPVYDGRREELMDQISKLPRAQQETILYGDWFVGEQAVFSFDANKHLGPAPGYSLSWPHIVSVDPAASGLMGYSVWAAPEPDATRWWAVESKYIRGAAPSDLVDQVEAHIGAKSVLFKICDTHESWFIKQAAKSKIYYRGVPNKHGRKLELITSLNEALMTGRAVLTPEAAELAAELQTAQWSERVEDRIANASSYHLADTAQYAIDALPRVKKLDPVTTWSFDQQMKAANDRRKKAEALRSGAHAPPAGWRIVARKGRTWRR